MINPIDELTQKEYQRYCKFIEQLKPYIARAAKFPMSYFSIHSFNDEEKMGLFAKAVNDLTEKYGIKERIITTVNQGEVNEMITDEQTIKGEK